MGSEQQQTPRAPRRDDVATQFLQVLLPAAAEVAAAAGGPVGSTLGVAMGGPGGAALGGVIGMGVGNVVSGLFTNLASSSRSLVDPSFIPDVQALIPGSLGLPVQQPFDLTGPMVQQCTPECLGTITPGLVTMLQGLYPQIEPGGGESRSAQAELESLERGWPEITAFLAHEVATTLPVSMQRLTRAVMPLLGTRDAAGFTPMITGPEVTPRVYMPVLCATIAAVQQGMPELLRILSGATQAPRETRITWGDVSVRGLIDHDLIRLIRRERIPSPNTLELVLELAPHLSWAKEIQVWDNNGSMIARLHVEGANKRAEARVPIDQISTNGSLLFAEAKTSGMTGMYVLPTADLQEQLEESPSGDGVGGSFTFRWISG